MMRLQASGILKHLYFTTITPPAPKPQPKLRKDQPLNMEQLGTAAIVLSFGLVIGSLIFLGELCVGSTPDRN